MATLRIDRLATLYFFHPLQRMTRSRSDLRIPILMYHSISCEEEQGVHPYYRVVTTPEVFDRHMAFLADLGYQAIGLDAAASLLGRDIGGHQGLPDKPVVITFDDGFLNFYTTAFPILARHGFTATIFLPTSFIGTDDRNLTKKAFLTWPQVSELADSGISFGSHTMSHAYLLGKTRAEVERELRQSKETIEERTGNPVRFFSYPYAFPENDKSFVAFLRNTLQACGYSCAVTTKIGTAAQGDDLLSLKRIPVNAADDLALLGAKIIGGYDWMHTAQYAVKSMQPMFGLRKRNSGKESEEDPSI